MFRDKINLRLQKGVLQNPLEPPVYGPDKSILWLVLYIIVFHTHKYTVKLHNMVQTS